MSDSKESSSSNGAAPVASAATTSSSSSASSSGGAALGGLLPIRFISTVIPGFGRGSKDLGIPTANLSNDDARCTVRVDDLPTGIYWGYGRIGESSSSSSSSSLSSTSSPKANDANSSSGGLGHTFTAAISIGYNPTYGNTEKTIEPHLIAPSDHPRRHSSSCGETLFQDFYGEPIRLSLVGYLRPELPFEGLEELTAAIKRDIVEAVRLGSRSSRSGEEEDEDGVAVAVAAEEKSWVERRDDDNVEMIGR